MADNAKKISELAIATTLAQTDRVVVLTSPASSANVKTITAANFANSIPAKFISNTFPVSNTSTGTPGQIAYDGAAVYICVANNKWGKAALTLAW
jgi:hypothetical protein